MPANKYSDTLLMDALRGSLSNAESFGRGFGVAPVGLLGDINALAREYITPRLPTNVQGLLQSMPSAPTTERILSAIPRMTAPRMESSGMEQIGAAANPRGPINLGRAVASLPSDVARAGQEFLAAGQPARVVSKQIPITNEVNGLLSYRSSHKAPSPEFGAPLYDLTGGGQMYPADVYSAKATQYYGTGFPKADKEAFALANKVRGNPDAEVTMYRAVPKDEKITNINAGDWVTLSKDYAKMHGESVLGNDYKILSQKVKAKDLWTNADSIHEFGYQPQSIEKPSFQYPQEQALKLAQERAALPVEQGGLGLLAENTPEMRAKAMGFESSYVHGSPNPDITNLKPSITGAQGEGIYATNYFPEANMYSGTKEGATNYPLYVKTQKALDVGEANPYDVLGFDLQGQLSQRQKDAIISKQKETEDWIIKNGVPFMPSRDHYVSTFPENFRSRFAAFDPFRKDVATATAMGVALPDLLAAEYNQQPQSAGLLYPLP